MPRKARAICEVAAMKIGRKLAFSLQRHGARACAIFAAGLLSLGCSQPEGTVEVNVGQAPLATAYRVDLYADQPGLDLVEGQSVVDQSTVTFSDIEQGRWSVLVQALNGDNTTIGHYIGKIEVQADQVTTFTAGTYLPGLPGDALPESDTELPSFGPDGSALLTAFYGPGVDSVPPASVTVTAADGTGQVEEEVDATATGTALAKTSADQVQGCATAWLIAQEKAERESGVLQQTEPTPSPSPTPAVDYGSLAPGESAAFYVATTFRTVEATRLLDDSQTEHCLIFAEVVDGQPVVSEARALEVAAAFDRDNPYQEGDDGIYQSTRARFGSEWNSNPTGGRDGDERVIFVFLSSGAIGGQGFFGFFRPQDELPRSQISNSNEGEILFLNADRANDDLYDALSTVSHEFTHLIVWNQKVGQNGALPEGAPSENVTIDEGLAVLNEDLSGFTFTGEQGGNFFLLAAVEALLEDGLNRPFFQFGGGLDDYGAGYLLNRYLHDRFGVETMRRITTSTSVGRENIASVLQMPFGAVFADFLQAVALNGESGLPQELSFDGVDLNETYLDRDGDEFVMNGLQGISELPFPGVFESEVTLQPWGAVFYRALGGDGNALSWKAVGADSLVTRIYDSINGTAPGGNPTPTPSETPSTGPTP